MNRLGLFEKRQRQRQDSLKKRGVLRLGRCPNCKNPDDTFTCAVCMNTKLAAKRNELAYVMDVYRRSDQMLQEELERIQQQQLDETARMKKMRRIEELEVILQLEEALEAKEKDHVAKLDYYVRKKTGTLTRVLESLQSIGQVLGNLVENRSVLTLNATEEVQGEVMEQLRMRVKLVAERCLPIVSSDRDDTCSVCGIQFYDFFSRRGAERLDPKFELVPMGLRYLVQLTLVLANFTAIELPFDMEFGVECIIYPSKDHVQYFSLLIHKERPNYHEFEAALDYLDRNIRYMCARVGVKEEDTLPRRPVHNLTLAIDAVMRTKSILPESALAIELEQSIIVTPNSTVNSGSVDLHAGLVIHSEAPHVVRTASSSPAAMNSTLDSRSSLMSPVSLVFESKTPPVSSPSSLILSQGLPSSTLVKVGRSVSSSASATRSPGSAVHEEFEASERVPLKNLVSLSTLSAGDDATIARELESVLEKLHKEWCHLCHVRPEPSPKDNSRSGTLFLSYHASYATQRMVQVVVVSEPIRKDSIVHVSWRSKDPDAKRWLSVKSWLNLVAKHAQTVAVEADADPEDDFVYV